MRCIPPSHLSSAVVGTAGLGDSAAEPTAGGQAAGNGWPALRAPTALRDPLADAGGRLGGLAAGGGATNASRGGGSRRHWHQEMGELRHSPDLVPGRDQQLPPPSEQLLQVQAKGWPAVHRHVHPRGEEEGGLPNV